MNDFVESPLGNLRRNENAQYDKIVRVLGVV